MNDLEISYVGVATADDGRIGRVRSDDHHLDVVLVTPPSVPYSVPRLHEGDEHLDTSSATNPEQLFAAAYSSDFHGALGAVAHSVDVDVHGSSVTAKVGLGRAEDGGLGLQVEIVVAVPGLERTQAEKLAHAAHDICPYSQALRGNVKVDVSVA